MKVTPLAKSRWGWVIGQIVLMAACVASGLTWSGQWLGQWHEVAALILTLVGAIFGVAGVWVLGRNRTIFPEPRARSVLIQHGIYRWVRHPLYTSVMMLSGAWGIWVRSYPALVGSVCLMLFLVLKSRTEEVLLLKRFPEYAEYRNRTPAFIPWWI